MDSGLKKNQQLKCFVEEAPWSHPSWLFAVYKGWNSTPISRVLTPSFTHVYSAIYTDPITPFITLRGPPCKDFWFLQFGKGLNLFNFFWWDGNTVGLSPVITGIYNLRLLGDPWGSLGMIRDPYRLSSLLGLRTIIYIYISYIHMIPTENQACDRLCHNQEIARRH